MPLVPDEFRAAYFHGMRVTSPHRIQLSRRKGWRMPPNTIRVARPGRWGNTWEVWQDDDGQWRASNGCCHHEVASKPDGLQLAVQLHEEEWRGRIGKYGTSTILAELRGKNLACWCPLDQPCHADVLLELANE